MLLLAEFAVLFLFHKISGLAAATEVYEIAAGDFTDPRNQEDLTQLVRNYLADHAPKTLEDESRVSQIVAASSRVPASISIPWTPEMHALASDYHGSVASRLPAGTLERCDSDDLTPFVFTIAAPPDSEERVSKLTKLSSLLLISWSFIFYPGAQ